MSAVNGKLCQNVVRLGENMTKDHGEKNINPTKVSVDALYWMLEDGISGNTAPDGLENNLANVLALCHFLQKHYGISEKQVDAAAKKMLSQGKSD